MKLLFAPWGSPKNWKELSYEFKGRKIKSNTSLKILQEVIKPDNTFIISLDTLAEKGINYQEIKKNAKEKVDWYARKFGLKNYEIIVAPGIESFPNGVFEGNALDYYYYILAETSINLLRHPYNELETYLDLTHGLNYFTILTYRGIKEVLEIISIFKK